MKEIVEKISNYHLFNYLLPGIIFAVIANKFINYEFSDNNLFIAVFIYYFMGLVISRFGSLVVEPILRRMSFIKFSDYKKFIKASENDEKIESLSETNNMYRTFCSMIILLLILRSIMIVELKYPALSMLNPYLTPFFLLILFLFSYRKQTEYIDSRIKQQEN